MQNIEQQMKTVDQVRNENSRLKDDIKRLHLILNDANKQAQKGSFLKKHFFGKPYREFELWYPTNIVGECEFFLKKEQIGCGNKDFLANLVKFVVNCMERSRNKDGKNARNSCCSKIS